MYYLLTLFTGVLISVMVAINGGLAGFYGVYSATVIIHIVGLLFITALLAIRRENPFTSRQAWFLYLGGVVGFFTTVFNNLAYGRISVSAILALGLLGQSISGIVIDQTGWLGMQKHPFQTRKLIGLTLVTAGIAAMTDRFDTMPVIVSLLTGVTIVVSRTINARLAQSVGMRSSTFFNYLTGFVVTIPVFLLFGRGETAFTAFSFSPDVYIYLGGVAGACVVLLSNLTVTKISAFYLSLFLFVGQVFSGILIDAFIDRAFSARVLAGGLLVSAGLCVNLIIERKETGGVVDAL